MNSQYDAVIPTINPEAGFTRVLNLRESLLKARLPLQEELGALHLLVTEHIPQEPLRSDHRAILEGELYSLDRPYDPRIHRTFEGKLSAMKDRFANMIPAARYLAKKVLLADLCRADTEVDLQPDPRGRLRQLGRRKIGDKPWEVVMGSSQTILTLSQDNESLSQDDRICFPKCFFGLTTGLQEVYDKLSVTYDRLSQEVKTIDDLVRVEAFLDLAGTRLIHPFCDGNGRTFTQHTLLSLAKRGIEVDSYDTVRRMTHGLSKISEMYLAATLGKNRVPFHIGEEEYSELYFSHRYRVEYMERLKAAALGAIERGVNDPTRWIGHAAWQIKSALIIGGFISGTPREVSRIYKETVAMEKVPPGLRERALILIDED